MGAQENRDVRTREKILRMLKERVTVAEIVTDLRISYQELGRQARELYPNDIDKGEWRLDYCALLELKMRDIELDMEQLRAEGEETCTEIEGEAAGPEGGRYSERRRQIKKRRSTEAQLYQAWLKYQIEIQKLKSEVPTGVDNTVVHIEFENVSPQHREPPN